ncbi:hypothetical protein NC653_038630 [Populus alba x Populus x berolinensis]|uniref:Uncharacterized protein n=1 Tax=Populus alba x Populus x berolinensis TaxID=444605 RepID=A0AAD6LHG3_9ROSI|nr:hypothetical protein NC653_038630 [Populus alba x Populus x berolinensis]
MPRHACSLDHIGKPWHDLSLSKTSLSMLINDEVVQSKPRERGMNSNSSFNHSSFLLDPVEGLKLTISSYQFCFVLFCF